MQNLHRLFAALTLLSLFSGFTQGFDTGSHFDLTQTVLAERGFGADAIKVTQVENWLTDYYSNSPTIAKSKRQELEKLHCDNLFSTTQVNNYFGWLINNLRESTQKTARDDDPLAMLTTLGIGLHTIQDFYAHSDWVETHPRPVGGTFRTDTFKGFDSTKDVINDALYFTGKYPTDRTSGPGPDPIPANAQIHGDYDNGLNHDSPVRPRWDEAYVFAYAASHELVEAIAGWADEARPGFWKKVQNYAVDADGRKKLDYDISATRNMSMWIDGNGQNGHWKGNKSGSDRFLAAFSGKWVAADSSVFVKQMKDGNISKALSANLYSNATPPPMLKLPGFSLRRRAVAIRTTLIKESGNLGKLRSALGRLGAPDYYSRTTIGTQEFWSRTMQGSREFTDPWYEICFIDQDAVSVPIRISVWDEDNIDSDRDAAVDISGKSGSFTLDLIFNTSSGRILGDLAGSFNTPQTAFTSSGAKTNKRRAEITAYVTQTLLR